MKLYTVDKPIPEWVQDHRDEIYNDVLVECENKLKNIDNHYSVDVAVLKTSTGVTKFVLKCIDVIVESLERAMEYFIEIEGYELAARARDCIKAFKQSVKINE